MGGQELFYSSLYLPQSLEHDWRLSIAFTKIKQIGFLMLSSPFQVPRVPQAQVLLVCIFIAVFSVLMLNTFYSFVHLIGFLSLFPRSSAAK